MYIVELLSGVGYFCKHNTEKKVEIDIVSSCLCMFGFALTCCCVCVCEWVRERDIHVFGEGGREGGSKERGGREGEGERERERGGGGVRERDIHVLGEGGRGGGRGEREREREEKRERERKKGLYLYCNRFYELYITHYFCVYISTLVVINSHLLHLM